MIRDRVRELSLTGALLMSATALCALIPRGEGEAELCPNEQVVE